MRSEGVIRAFTLHIRGGGDPLVDIVNMCKANGWVAVDYSDGTFIDLEIALVVAPAGFAEPSTRRAPAAGS
jgi:hypothetical protein